MLSRPIRVLVLGGSVTIGRQVENGDFRNTSEIYRWTTKLQRLLDLTLCENMVEIENFAHSSTDIEMNWRRVLTRAKSGNSSLIPDMVVVATHTNDQVKGREFIDTAGERVLRGLLLPDVSCIKPPPLVLVFEDVFYCCKPMLGQGRCPRSTYFSSNASKVNPVVDHSAVADLYHIPSVQWPYFAKDRLDEIPRYVDQYYSEINSDFKATIASLHPASPVHYMIALLLAKSLVVT